MHDMRLIHTDLKPENILFVSSEYVKVPDYKVCPLVMSLLCSWCFLFFSFFLLSPLPMSRYQCSYYFHLFYLHSYPWVFKFFLCCRSLHPGHQKMEPVIKGCQSLVLSRSLILVALPMTIKSTTTLSRQGTTAHQRLFLVC